MSEFIAEASVLVRPDTTLFRAQLEKQLLAATRGVVVPVNVVASGAGAQQVAGGLKTLNDKSKETTKSLLGVKTATAQLDAGLLGLRTALGSTAVIGLGAVSLAAIAAGKAVRQMLIDTAAFEQELNTFQAVTGATADEMTRVSDAATALGADVRLPAVSAADAAIAMTELAKAGLSVQDSIAGAEGVLQLATAAQLSNAEASQIAANALNSFGLAGDQAVRVADDFANAANAAQGSIADIGLAFRQASAVARQVGLTLEDTTAILSLFAKNGLQGSDAGTSLRVALIRLVAPTKAAAAEIQKLGLNIRDAQGNLRADVFAQFGESTKNLGPAARDAAAALIFGQDAIRAVSIGAREGAEGLRLMQFEIDQQGTAAEVSAARTEGLAGSFSALQSNLQTVGIQLGALVQGPLQATIDGFSDTLTSVSKLIKALEDLGKVKIPVIEVPIKVLFDGGDGRAGKLGFFSSLPENLDATLSGIEGILKGKNLKFGTLEFVDDKELTKLQQVTQELQALQKARILAEKGGASVVADQITKRIGALKLEQNALKDLKDEGKGVDTDVAAPLKRSIEALEKLKESARQKDVPFIDALIKRLREQTPIVNSVLTEMNKLGDGMAGLANIATDSAAGVDALTKSLKDLKAASFAANSELLKLQNEGASPQAQIANLQGQRKIQEDRIAAIKSNGNQAGDATAINAAREEINRIQGQIDSLQAGIVSDQEAAAASAKEAATKAQTARDNQFKALADLFGGRQQNIEDAISRAGIAGNIAKELRLNKALIASLIKERNTLLARLRELKVSAAVRKAIFDAINRAIESAQQEQLRFQQQQQENLFKVFDFKVSLAQAKDDTVAELKARRARLAAITAELIRVKNTIGKNTDRWRELRLAQAEEIAAIKALEKENNKKKDAQKSLFFSFLQTQQGFAANLLGNLIPGFATKGLVGGSTPTPGQAAFDTGRRPDQGVQTAADFGAARDRGVRPVQVDTTNALLRQILAALGGRHTAPPEARYQQTEALASMDTMGAGY